MITLRISHHQPTPLVSEAAQLAARLTSTWLEKDPRVTAVQVSSVPTTVWFVAGKSLQEQRKSSFFLEVRVSDGSNTKQQKERFIAEAFRAFGELLGDLHPESYIHVIDARADAYGYGGRTQERRYVEGRLAELAGESGS